MEFLNVEDNVRQNAGGHKTMVRTTSGKTYRTLCEEGSAVPAGEVRGAHQQGDEPVPVAVLAGPHVQSPAVVVGADVEGRILRPFLAVDTRVQILQESRRRDDLVRIRGGDLGTKNRERFLPSV